MHVFLSDFNKQHSLIRAISKVTDSENLQSVAIGEIPFEVSIETRDISPYVAEVFTDNRSIDSLLYQAWPESKETKVLNMYSIFNLQKRHCEWIACT